MLDPVKIPEKSPFIRMIESPAKGGTIRDIFGLSKTKGEVGLEVEVEGNQFPKPEDVYDSYGDLVECGVCEELPKMWKYTHDGSLRGQDNAEYILEKPLKFNEVNDAIDQLWKMFDDYDSVLDESNRTSIHVHLNAQSWHLNRVCTFFGLYIIVEDILTHWCGDHRVGNLFCLRAKDAPAIVSRMKQFLQSEHGYIIDGGMHYSGLNAHALKKLGSIEVRTMRGVKDPETIKTWVSVLRHIYDLSGQYPDPRNVVQSFSGQTRQDFLKHIVGPNWEEILEGSGMSYQQLEESLLEGVRLAQQLCYCRDWSKYQPKVNKDDPFGRTVGTQGPAPEPLPGLNEAESPINSAPSTYNLYNSSTHSVQEIWAGEDMWTANANG